MNNQNNITLVRKLFDEVFTKGHLDVLDQICDHNIGLIDTSAPQFKGGLKALKEREAMYKKAFPNKHVHIDEIFSADDKVVVRWTTTASNKGDLQDIPATGKNIKVTGISIYKIINNKIAQIDQAWDRLGLLEQMGVIEDQAAALHR